MATIYLGAASATLAKAYIVLPLIKPTIADLRKRDVAHEHRPFLVPKKISTVLVTSNL